MSKLIHPLADVQTTAIGDDTRIWQFCVVLKNARIGSGCNICSHVFIENDVVIGNNVTVKCGVQLWDGITVGDNVFIGSNATFTNDMVPRSKHEWTRLDTVIEEGATIGANATVMAGLRIGRYAFVGAGSVVTHDVPPFTLWYGNPAVQKGYVTADGIVLDMEKKDKEGKVHSLW